MTIYLFHFISQIHTRIMTMGLLQSQAKNYETTNAPMHQSFEASGIIGTGNGGGGRFHIFKCKAR